MTDREDKIRQRAYGIWEEEGYPHGRADDHWHRAAREVEAQPQGTTPAQPQAESAAPAEPAPAPKARRSTTATRKRTTKA